MLPQEFLVRMQEMLKEEYEEFLESYEKKHFQSLRLNPLKKGLFLGKEEGEVISGLPFTLSPVPWEKHGYYYEPEEQPGKHPFHEAGLYYIQEASAMSPVHFLKPNPGEKILDMCAAPGGKSTQIAAAMQGEGLLVCNEIHPVRAKALSENVERMGIRNALVLNETPQNLAEHFEEYFDKILVDAPCSGEGMFRKNADACEEWSIENVQMCAARQDEILDAAAGMLKLGGRLVYSTCTFAPDENEGSIWRFINRHPDFMIEPVELVDGMQPGRAEWIGKGDNETAVCHTIRLWPHRINGEGHYVAVLRKAGQSVENYNGFCKFGNEQGIQEKECKEYIDFKQEYLRCKLDGIYIRFGDQLYLAPEGLPSLHKLKVLRAGLHLGTIKKNRFEPSHALALAIGEQDVKQSLNFSSISLDIRSYLNGLTLQADGEKGWYLVCVDGYSIGWGKLTGTILKNHYPKGLRGK